MKALDLTGRRFGKWLVLHRADNLGNDRRWFCKCQCGAVKPVQVRNLMGGYSQACHKCAAKRSGYGVASFRAVLGSYKKNAALRNLSWNLSDEQFQKITQGSCAYCGTPPSLIYQKKHCDGPFIYNGVDRVDSTLGYDEDNAVSCCKLCNWMKSNLTLGDFLGHITLISKHSLLQL